MALAGANTITRKLGGTTILIHLKNLLKRMNDPEPFKFKF